MFSWKSSQTKKTGNKNQTRYLMKPYAAPKYKMWGGAAQCRELPLGVWEDAVRECLWLQIAAEGAKHRPCEGGDTSQWAKPIIPDLEQALWTKEKQGGWAKWEINYAMFAGSHLSTRQGRYSHLLSSARKSKGYIPYIPLPHLITDITVKWEEFLLTWIWPDSNHYTRSLPVTHTHTHTFWLNRFKVSLQSRIRIKNNWPWNNIICHRHIVCHGKRRETPKGPSIGN